MMNIVESPSRQATVKSSLFNQKQSFVSSFNERCKHREEPNLIRRSTNLNLYDKPSLNFSLPSADTQILFQSVELPRHDQKSLQNNLKLHSNRVNAFNYSQKNSLDQGSVGLYLSTHNDELQTEVDAKQIAASIEYSGTLFQSTKQSFMKQLNPGRQSILQKYTTITTEDECNKLNMHIATTAESMFQFPEFSKPKQRSPYAENLQKMQHRGVLTKLSSKHQNQISRNMSIQTQHDGQMFKQPKEFSKLVLPSISKQQTDL